MQRHPSCVSQGDLSGWQRDRTQQALRDLDGDGCGALLLVMACAHREESPRPLADVATPRLGRTGPVCCCPASARRVIGMCRKTAGRSSWPSRSLRRACTGSACRSTADQLGTLAFSWRVPALMPQADLSDRDSADSPARIVLAFDGDHRRLSAKNRTLFELAETLTGEAPPYATLMYVWDGHSALEVGTARWTHRSCAQDRGGFRPQAAQCLAPAPARHRPRFRTCLR